MAQTTPTADSAESLLDPDFMARLEQLEIVSRKIFASRQKGDRRSKRKGESAEFADYRNYVSGDDLRHIDWNIYARLDRLFLKLFLEEEDLNVSILLDVSKSMGEGKPDKSLFAKRVAAAISYIALCNHNRVNIYVYRDGVAGQLSGLRGRRSMSRVIQLLESTEVDGKSHFAAAAKSFALRHTQKGILLVLSDFLDKSGVQDGLRYLFGRSLDIYLIHVLSPQELKPDLAGDLRLVDCEDEDVAEITVSKPLIDKYRAALEAHCQSIRDYCTQRGASYLLTPSDSSFETLVISHLRQRGLLR